MPSPREIAMSAYDASAREFLAEALGQCRDDDPIWVELYMRAIIENDVKVSTDCYLDGLKEYRIEYFNCLRREAEQSRRNAIVKVISLFRQRLNEGISKSIGFLAQNRRDVENIRYYGNDARREREGFVRVTFETVIRAFILSAVILSCFMLYAGYKIGVLAW